MLIEVSRFKHCQSAVSLLCVFVVFFYLLFCVLRQQVLHSKTVHYYSTSSQEIQLPEYKTSKNKIQTAQRLCLLLFL